MATFQSFWAKGRSESYNWIKINLDSVTAIETRDDGAYVYIGSEFFIFSEEEYQILLDALYKIHIFLNNSGKRVN